jgi:hypothetical protein
MPDWQSMKGAQIKKARPNAIVLVTFTRLNKSLAAVDGCHVPARVTGN